MLTMTQKTQTNVKKKVHLKADTCYTKMYNNIAETADNQCDCCCLCQLLICLSL